MVYVGSTEAEGALHKTFIFDTHTHAATSSINKYTVEEFSVNENQKSLLGIMTECILHSSRIEFRYKCSIMDLPDIMTEKINK